VELHLERSGLFFYRYRRLRVERNGRRAAVREFSLQLDYDFDLEPVTKPRQLVRQRGRSLSVEEADAFWAEVRAQRPERLADSYPCLDDTLEADLDPTLGPDGVPIAVSAGEEGPACFSVRRGRPGERLPQRIVVERFRAPKVPGSSSSPLANLVALVDPGLRDAQPFNYRRTRAFVDLSAEFEALKAVNFLNLRDFERRCLEVLAWLGDSQAVPYLTAALFAPDPRVRLQALDALAAVGHGAAAGDVELLYYDEEPEVRERARQVLGQLLNSV
jgi:hypothetical protein